MEQHSPSSSSSLAHSLMRVDGARALLDRDNTLLSEVLGEWMLIGRPVVETRPEDGWSFRTRSLGPKLVTNADGATFAVRPDDIILPLRKVQKAGPFSALILIGRASSNDVQINHRSVSKLHARIELAAHPILEDASSSNGTFVDEKKLAPSERRPLRSADVVGFGSCAFQLISLSDLAPLLRALTH